ncbi:transposase [Methyloglobulus sp.]|uniref:transposase n=1 Tax=Methyloglobulus sp. TaxID=2518622 RepID=UPI003989E7E3
MAPYILPLITKKVGSIISTNGICTINPDTMAIASGCRTPQGPRKVFEGILCVLRAGCPWEALPKGGVGGASAVHQCFLEWRAAGLFEGPWRAGLLEYRELGGWPGNGKAWAARWPRHRWRWSRWAGTPPAGGKRQQQGPVG